MRRRDEGVERGPQYPPDLLTFDGREHTYPRDWEAAYSAWTDARAAWEAEHPDETLPKTVLSNCPFDADHAFGPVNPATHEVQRRGGSVHITRCETRSQ